MHAWEMGRRHRHVAALELPGQGVAGPLGQGRVDVAHALPLVVEELDGAVDDVAEQRRLAGRPGPSGWRAAARP